MVDGGRIIAVTYSPGGRTGSRQPWVAMEAAKAASDALMRYFAVAALAPAGHHHREWRQTRGRARPARRGKAACCGRYRGTPKMPVMLGIKVGGHR